MFKLRIFDNLWMIIATKIDIFEIRAKIKSKVFSTSSSNI